MINPFDLYEDFANWIQRESEISEHLRVKHNLSYNVPDYNGPLAGLGGLPYDDYDDTDVGWHVVQGE